MNREREHDIVKGQFTNYLTKAVYRHAASYFRRQERLDRIEILLQEMKSPTDFKEMENIGCILDELDNKKLFKAIQNMDYIELQVLIEKSVYRYTFTEIANRMGLSESHVKDIYYRLIKKLKERVNDHDTI